MTHVQGWLVVTLLTFSVVAQVVAILPSTRPAERREYRFETLVRDPDAARGQLNVDGDAGWEAISFRWVNGGSGPDDWHYEVVLTRAVP